jgi:hypothetical protein
MSTRDRRTRLISSATLNGIDFVEIANSSQTQLNVHFLNAVTVAGSLTAAPTMTGGDTIPSVTVQPVALTNWSMDGSHVVLTLRVAAPGDFSTYTLTVPSARLDSFYATARFPSKRCASPTSIASSRRRSYRHRRRTRRRSIIWQRTS